MKIELTSNNLFEYLTPRKPVNIKVIPTKESTFIYDFFVSRGFSTRQLGNVMGISQQSVWRYLTGLRPMPNHIREDFDKIINCILIHEKLDGKKITWEKEK